MLSAQDLLDKKAHLLLSLLIFLIVLLLLFDFICLPRLESCLFVDPWVCLKAKNYKKYNWAGKGFRLNKPQKVKAPFSGNFVYSPSGTMNYEGGQVGETGVLVFENKDFGMIKLYVEEIRNLRGQVAVQRKVEKGEVVAEVLSQGIEFLDNYSAAEIRMPK